MFTRLLQKFLIVFFVGTFAIVLIIGASRIKKQISIVAVNDGSSNTPSANNSSANSGGSAVTGSNITPSQGQNTTPTAKSPSSTVQTFTGTTYRIPWGDVTAEIKVQNGKIIAVSMPNVPDSSPSLYAQPTLVDQALKAGSSNIQGVSGATYTSLAFQKSLESAIVKASSALKSTSGASAGTSGNSTVTANPSGSVSPTPLSLPSNNRNYGNYGDD
jgi:uncharacterized protein with FMN-binding domain